MFLFIYFLGRISRTDKSIWRVFFKLMTNSGLLTNILQCLVIQNSHIAALWVVELCLVVNKNNKKNDIKHSNNQYNCMNFKPLNLDTNLVLRTALNSTHPFTVIFLKW